VSREEGTVKASKTERRELSALSSLRPSLPSICQSSWLQSQMSRVRFPALPDFLCTSGSGTGSNQPHEDK
jgi:hypothetical protein